MKRFVIIVLVMLMGVSAAWGQGGGAPVIQTAQAADADPLAPFVDDQTMLVAHLDVSRVNLDALEKFATGILDQMKVPPGDASRLELATGRMAADGFLTRFKELGGRHVYLVLDQEDIWPNMTGPAVLVKLEPNGNLEGISSLLQGLHLPTGLGPPRPLGSDWLCIGYQRVYERLKELKPQPRPDLAFLGQEALEIVCAQTPDQRRVISELMPRLPAEFGGDSTEFITRDLESTHLIVSLPPAAGIRVVLRGAAGTGSQTSRMAAEIVRLRDLLFASKEFQEAMRTAPPGIDAQGIQGMLKDFLTPKVEQVTRRNAAVSDVTLEIGSAQMERLTQLLLPALAEARQSAQRATSAANIRSILQACFVYANDNKGTLPESLDVLVQGGLVKPEQLVNPTDPQHRRYVYRRLVPEWNKIDPATPLVWEQMDERSEGANMGFGDGHVEYVRGREQVQAKISAAEASRPREPGRTDRP